MKTNNKETNTTTWIDKLSIYQTAMDYEESIRTSYQSLLTTLEVGILGLIFILIQLKFTDYLWILFVTGITLCFFFGIACEFRAENVDVWRREIVKLLAEKASGSDVETAFKDAKYSWIPVWKAGFWGEYLFGHWFERILISGIVVIWVYMLWRFHSPLLIRLCSILAMCIWIITCFHLTKLKGAYYK